MRSIGPGPTIACLQAEAPNGRHWRLIETLLNGTPEPVIGRLGEQVFHDEEQRLRLLVESTADYAIVVLNTDGTIATWNAGAERSKGYRASEIIGKHFSCFYGAADIAGKKPQLDLLVAEHTGRLHEEGWRVRKNGETFWASVTISALRDAAGLLLGFGTIIKDLTDRRWTDNEQFRQALEAAPTGMLMAGKDGRLVLVNGVVERLFGYSREELIGAFVDILVPGRFPVGDPGHWAGFLSNPDARVMGVGLELFGLRKDGSEVPVELGLNPLETPDGRFVLCSVVDVTERQRAERDRTHLLTQLQALNAELEERITARNASLREREVLLQEVHHRVKNNLQVISSMINMQVRQLKDDSSRDALEQCQMRVQAIALIHEKLYQSKDYSRVSFGEYARSLAADVFQMTGTSPTGIDLDIAIYDVALSVDKAIPCGLILNELITNAVKHAFPDKRQGRIRVELRMTGADEMLLAVSDDGVGIPAAFDVKTATSLGMQLITTLSEQLDGRLEILREPGTTVQVFFPAGA